MLVTILKGSSQTVYNNVIALTVTDRDKTTVQIIYQVNGLTHVDTIESNDITQVGIQIVIPTPSQE